MLRRFVRVAVWLAIVDIALGVVYDGQRVGGTWRSCAAVTQHVSSASAAACEELAKASVTQGIPWVSREIVREARIIWQNSRAGKNTI